MRTKRIRRREDIHKDEGLFPIHHNGMYESDGFTTITNNSDNGE